MVYQAFYSHGLFGSLFCGSSGRNNLYLQLLTKQYPGMRLWLSQRLTALAMASYIFVLVLMLLILQPTGFEAWHNFVAPVWFRLATLVFFMCLFMHAWLGISDVLKDYVFNIALRGYMQIAVDVLLVAYLFWLIFILWNV